MSGRDSIEALAQKGSHLRRRSPAQSKSSPRNKRQKLSHTPEYNFQEGTNLHHSRFQTQPIIHQSKDEDSATKWFDQVNTNVGHSKEASRGFDDEPPFYMTSQTTYLPTNLVHQDNDEPFGIIHLPDDSENQDLRGVIDDLTIENKRLKKIIRHGRSQPNVKTEGHDKLFEVRMHGLPAEKKRELELLLKNFATAVHATSSLSSSKVIKTEKSSLGNQNDHLKAPAPDSGYISQSNSAMASATPSNGGGKFVPTSKISIDRNVKNYLHDIPDTLHPQQYSKMSEHAKMVLVVRRLEQLFTGKIATPGEHSQPMQQQEVSQSAARADRTEDVQNNRKRPTEGAREAYILASDAKVNLDVLDHRDSSPSSKRSQDRRKSDGSEVSMANAYVDSTSHPGSPEQRPTRPLDLDIQRAQVAADNIEYIRHLGLSSPSLDQVKDVSEDSWIYLNLLTNMAQLHTINVTPTFIRRAIKKLSSKIELSKDGRKLRWKGGTEGTLFSGDEERSIEAIASSAHESTEEMGGSSSKRSKTNSTSQLLTSNTPSEDKTNGQQTSHLLRTQLLTEGTSNIQTVQTQKKSKSFNAFDYKPIVYRGKRYISPEASYLDSSSCYDSVSGDSNGLVNALSKSSLNPKQNSEQGMLTFFNNPYFCTDMSGNAASGNRKPEYSAMTTNTIGLGSELTVGEELLRQRESCYFNSQSTISPNQPTPDEPRLEFTTTNIFESGEDKTLPMELPASGVGRVFPEDNFALDVKISRTCGHRGQVSSGVKRSRFLKTFIPSKFLYNTQSCQRLDLHPAKLPPPTYIFFTSSSSSDAAAVENQSTGSESSTSADEEDPPPHLQQWSTETSDDENSGGAQDELTSVHMLHAARAVDPERITEKERKFVINKPGQCTAVAGSLAATVGASRSSSSAGDNELQSDGSEICGDLYMEIE